MSNIDDTLRPTIIGHEQKLYSVNKYFFLKFDYDFSGELKQLKYKKMKNDNENRKHIGK